MTKDDEVFISIVVVLTKFPHLIRHTLNSIAKQTFSSYEVLVITKRSEQQLVEIPKELGDKARLFRLRDASLGKLLNRGIDKSKGKYIQFLQSGDAFLQPTGLDEIATSLKDQSVDLFYSAYIKREESVMYAKYKPFKVEGLRRGKLYTHLESCVFLRKSLISIGKFYSGLTYHPGLEILLRFFQDDKMTNIFVKKVFCDHEVKRKSPAEVFHEVAEIFWILCKRVGIFQAIRWFFLQEHFHVYQWTKRMLKKAFFRT